MKKVTLYTDTTFKSITLTRMVGNYFDWGFQW
jgi:hypothetical protein